MQSKDLFLLLETLKANANVAVVYSGDPKDPSNVLYQSHNSRSWKSYKTVALDIVDALKKQGFKQVFLMQEGAGLWKELLQKKIHFAWLNTGGVQGFDSMGHCPGMLQSLGVPYVGHSPLQAALMDDKIAFKYFLNGAGVRTAPFTTWHPRDNTDALGAGGFHKRLVEILSWDNGKFVVKPACGRASQHIYVANSTEEVLGLCRQVYSETGNKVMVEQFLPGKEYCVAVMGWPIQPGSCEEKGWAMRHQKPICFAQFERVLDDPQGIFTSMDTRPINESVVKTLDPSIHGNVIRELNLIASGIYSKLGLYGLVRLDVRMDAAGRMHVLEANPKPDLKAPEDGVTSLVAMGLKQLGMSYEELIEQIFLHTLDYQSAYSVTSQQLDWLVQKNIDSNGRGPVQ